MAHTGLREITDHALASCQTQTGEKEIFVFHGLLRPTFMIWGKMNYTIYDRITSLTPDRKYAMDTGLKRIVIPIERNQE